MTPFLASVISGWKWFMASPIAQGIAALLAAVIGYKVWKMNVEHGVRRLERERARAETINTVHTIEKEATLDANRAIAAGDSLPPVSRPDELPDDVRAVIFRGHPTSGPDR